MTRGEGSWKENNAQDPSPLSLDNKKYNVGQGGAARRGKWSPAEGTKKILIKSYKIDTK